MSKALGLNLSFISDKFYLTIAKKEINDKFYYLLYYARHLLHIVVIKSDSSQGNTVKKR